MSCMSLNSCISHVCIYVYIYSNAKSATILDSQLIFLQLLLAFFGLASLLRASLALLSWIWAAFLRPEKDLKRMYGPWAIVTGPADGIGKSIAFNLARKGLNLMLIDKDRDKLDIVTLEIREKFDRIEVKSMVFDLAKDVDEGIRRLEEGIEGLDVGILVNNAAVASPECEVVHEVDRKLVETIIRVNVEALTRVTLAVISQMVKKKKKKGVVVNMGSGGATILPSFPLMTIYASTKAYIAQFSRSLYAEYKHQGIDVQCQVPLFVATKMSTMKPSFFIPTADEYAKCSVCYIGHDEAICSPYWTHVVQGFFVALVPAFIFNKYLLNLIIRLDKHRRPLCLSD